VRVPDMKNFTPFVVMLSFIGLATGCATTQDVGQVERQTAGINAGLREIKGNLDEINYALQAEGKLNADTLEALRALEKAQAESSSSLKTVMDDLEAVKRSQADMSSRMFTGAGAGAGVSDGKVEELRHEITNVNAKLDALKAALMQRLAELEAALPAKASGTGAGSQGEAGQASGNAGASRPPVPQGDPTQMYQAAYLDYTKGNYELALAGFREFLKAFPDAEFAGNAQYWTGESLYSLGRYEEALAEFDRVLAGYPGSTKAPGAMLKKGFAYEALGKPREAKEAFQGVIKKFPESEAARLAEERLKKK
ncbi:MAG TPA: tol-pal system protein YbgF, partial [Nitrospirota bacterium]|nr:tol-pal system protein YbgF [Nitrospirota bacterium]